jgi:hypothetical protein
LESALESDAFAAGVFVAGVLESGFFAAGAFASGCAEGGCAAGACVAGDGGGFELSCALALLTSKLPYIIIVAARVKSFFMPVFSHWSDNSANRHEYLRPSAVIDCQYQLLESA